MALNQTEPTSRLAGAVRWFVSALAITVLGIPLTGGRTLLNEPWQSTLDAVWGIALVASVFILMACLLATGLQWGLDRLLPAQLKRRGWLASLVGGVSGILVLLVWTPFVILAPYALYAGMIAGYLSTESRRPRMLLICGVAIVIYPFFFKVAASPIASFMVDSLAWLHR